MRASASAAVSGLVRPCGLSTIWTSTTSAARCFIIASAWAGAWAGAPEQAMTRPITVHVMFVVLEQGCRCDCLGVQSEYPQNTDGRLIQSKRRIVRISIDHGDQGTGSQFVVSAGSRHGRT